MARRWNPHDLAPDFEGTKDQRELALAGAL